MRKFLSASHLAVCALGALSLFGCSSGLVQSGNQPVDQPPSSGPTGHANGIVQDWSTAHTLYPTVGPIHSMMVLQSDFRAIQSWQETQRQDALRARNPVRFPNIVEQAHTDWSISLGSGSVAASMYPAKFTFDVTAAPACLITTVGATPPPPDYAVFAVNVAASSSQPNLVAFQDLYSGTTPTIGICNTQRPTYFTGDTVASAATFWSYAITAADGVIATSPTLSPDGTKVAFVEKGAGTHAHFHVLAFNGGTTVAAGDGVTTSNSQTVTNPKVINSGFVATQPAANSGTVTDLSLGSAADTLSSPFVDYGNDVAYVGNDAGVLFRIKNVFCLSPGCSGGGSPAPSLDTSWGGTGSVSVCSGVLTGAVVDSNTGHIFVGCSDGKLYGFTKTGASLAAAVTVGPGSGTTGGGIVDPPMIDAVNKFVYAVAGASGVAGPEVVVQASTVDLSGVVTATLGAGGQFNMHDPAFNNAYFNGGTAFLYAWGLNSGNSQIELWGITFGVGKTMTGGTPVNGNPITGSSPVELSPVTEFFNGGTSVDTVFVGGLVNVSPNFLSFNVTAGFPAGLPTANAGEGSGTSGIIVDNQSNSAQASSIYFGTLGVGGNNAAKLTQATLQ